MGTKDLTSVMFGMMLVLFKSSVILMRLELFINSVIFGDALELFKKSDIFSITVVLFN